MRRGANLTFPFFPLPPPFSPFPLNLKRLAPASQVPLPSSSLPRLLEKGLVQEVEHDLRATHDTNEKRVERRGPVRLASDAVLGELTHA